MSTRLPFFPRCPDDALIPDTGGSQPASLGNRRGLQALADMGGSPKKVLTYGPSQTTVSASVEELHRGVPVSIQPACLLTSGLCVCAADDDKCGCAVDEDDELVHLRPRRATSGRRDQQRAVRCCLVPVAGPQLSETGVGPACAASLLSLLALATPT
jgi:hypothetical protein